MAEGALAPALVTKLLILQCIAFSQIVCQVLTPPTFNLAKGKRITASATCGVGRPEPELYCRLTGATGEEEDTSREIIQGQLCDYCDVTVPEQNHSAVYAIDGTERWWQSPPLSRGEQYNEVNVTIDLGQEFHIAYIIIKMANSPRPGVWTLERSADNAQTWQPWMHFADTPSDCVGFFNTPANEELTSDDQVVCTTEFSRIVPLEKGEIVVSLVNGRPNANNFSYADTLQDWIKATTVRLRLQRAKTLLGHLMAVATQDPTVTRRYFYSIRDISIGGRCVCNGHSDTCNYLDPTRPDALICVCQHNTIGDQCEFCDVINGFVQKKWQPARADQQFVCEPCQCYNRATGCVYDPEVDANSSSIDIHGNYEGGGVCQNCGYNSKGINCEQCVFGYYRPYGVPLTDLYMCKECECDLHFSTGDCEDQTGRCLCRKEFTGLDCDKCSFGYYDYPTCKPCDCDQNGTEDFICTVGEGQCPCKPNYVGKKCDMCQFGWYNFPECIPCVCNPTGTANNTHCDVDSGQCQCEMNYGGRDCGRCADGYYNYPTCDVCACDLTGSIPEVCDKGTGQCYCQENFNGERCDVCARGYYGYPYCDECQCQEPGSTSNLCADNGQCQCKPNFAGLNCERCAAGYYKYPECIPCTCDLYGSYGESCDQETGQCDCLFNFQGLRCDTCKEGLYNYPNCEECNCNPAGAKEVPGYRLGGCGDVVPGLLCECKERVMGRICDTCKPGYWNLNRNNLLGCDECTCSEAGTIAGMNMCNVVTGQCPCKVDVDGRNCDRCRNGYYNLMKTNLFGCTDCFCDIGGSVSPVCDKETGQCVCKPRVFGRRCDQPIKQHFIPYLDHVRYELEDGYTREGHQVRYGYDERLFPDFSWKGYAILMDVQPEVLMDIEITKPSLYRLIYRYVNRDDSTSRGSVTFRPQAVDDIVQMSEVLFPSATNPSFATVGTTSGEGTFVLNPGKWTVSIKSGQNVFLDYMFLVPQGYYEATVLQERVNRPCTVPTDEGPCIHYNYPNVTDFPYVLGEDGYIIVDGERVPVELLTEEIATDQLAVLNPNQKTFDLDLNITEAGKYVLLLNYFSNGTGTQNILFDVGDEQATALLYHCEYSSLCRQILTSLIDEMQAVFDFDVGYVNIKVTGEDDVNAAIHSIVAIPYDQWKIQYIRPSIVCIRINGVCVGSRYSTPSGTVRIDFESFPNEPRRGVILPPGLMDINTGLVRLNATDSMIELNGTAINPGQHKMVVQYYMPYSPGAEMPVIITANGQEYKGIFRPRYCPTVIGCRGLVYLDTSGNDIINLQDLNVHLLFNNTAGVDIWLDYLLLIPLSQFSPTALNLLPVDHSINFIDDCIDQGFKIKQPITDFCRESIFTLTTEFNNGALECECDIDGSLSFNCDAYGGQCQCRPNVIGRTCSACRVGYYGFPRCKPCNCPFGLCHPVSGDCICPPRVTGERCDVCMPGTYGYDQLIGCEECECNLQGTVDSDINCDELNGQCRCMPNIQGRRCDSCVAGFHSFPLCRECDCNRDGTLEDICDATSAQCLCKGNVIGPRCDICEDFSYNLDPRNPQGCTKCFCFGNTANCISSSLRWDTITDMTDWGITNTVDGQFREAGTTIALLDAVDKIDDTTTSLYWTVSTAYLGNRVTSYGGSLRYKIIYVLPRNESIVTEAIIQPDVIIVGNNMTIEYYSSAQPAPSQFFSMEAELFEYNFYHPGSGDPVDREQFMMILVDVQAIHIRASYYSIVQEIRLSEVSMDVATAVGTGGVASSVEECICPLGYTGTSCEECDAGFYRSRTFPYLGTCVPCECNNHADTCDSITGECLGCYDNTMGRHCELCLPGYFGDPAIGSCYMCGCPLLIESNNFATGCSSIIEERRVLQCFCFEGYTGDRCERCAPGYYGDPRVEGETCERCECSNNLDMNDPESCDFQTGACLLCVNNSTGRQCERCKDWWYGDAVVEKNCQECSCDTCGSLSCDSNTGTCICKPNVMGIDCDRCAPNTYGFDSCTGCISCDCAEAAVTPQCNLTTGTCYCQPGVTGQTCDRCQNGYWNYGPQGCQQCECEFDGAVTCDPENGRCQCLPGVTGDRCDTCLDRWVLIPNEGCRECDSCVHELLDDTDYMDRNITITTRSMQVVAVGVFLNRRLDWVNESVIELQPLVQAVYDIGENFTLEPQERDVALQNQISLNTLTRTQKLMADANGMNEGIAELLLSSGSAEDMVHVGEQDSRDAVQHVISILEKILAGIQVTNIDVFIEQSQILLDEIRSHNFTAQNESCLTELEAAEMLVQMVKEQQTEPMAQFTHSTERMEDLSDINRRFRALQNETMASETDSANAMELVDTLRQETVLSIEDHIEMISITEANTSSVLTMAGRSSKGGVEALDSAEESLKELRIESTKMDEAKKSLILFSEDMETGLDQVEPLVNQSRDHADMLEEQAGELEKLYMSTREAGKEGIQAANVYDNIVEAINSAHNASDMALQAAESALEKSVEVQDQFSELSGSSEDLLANASARYNTTKTELMDRLEYGKDATMVVEDLNEMVIEENDKVDSRLAQIPMDGAGARAQDVITKGDNAESEAEASKNRVEYILAAVPQHLEKTQPLANDVVNTNSAINSAKQQVVNVKKFIPNISTLLQDAADKSQKVKDIGRKVTSNINALREKIDIARNQANLIRVALNYVGNTSVTLRNPSNLEQTGSYSTMSTFIKTDNENGLLVYAGGQTITGRLAADYMALELKDGNVVFKFDLGSGVAEITHPHYVADGTWYKVTAKRIGKAGTLTLARDPKILPELGSVEGESPGTFTVLALNDATTRFYAGGIPDGANISPEVSKEYYVGVMEDLEFDERPMGLWNFQEGSNNYAGARERNVMTSIESNGFRFDGNGYVILSRQETKWMPSERFDILMKMKTYAEEGLLFYAGKDRDFVSLEVHNGKMRFQYDLGGGRAVLESPEKYNDGEWHNIQLSRDSREGYMQIDGQEVAMGESKGTLSQLSVSDDISVGGYQELILPVLNVTRKGFEGCIQDLTVQTNIWDLNNNKQSKGVSPGCPEQIARVASFASGKSAFVAKPQESIGMNFDITFKVKTQQDNALLLYAANTNKPSGFSISVVDGKISVLSDPGTAKTELMSRFNTYNDSRWHYISIMKMGRKLMLNIDDYETVEQTSDDPDDNLETNTPLYFGGSADIDITPQLVGSTEPLVGCIGDVTVNGRFLNFATLQENKRRDVSLAGCPIADPEGVLTRNATLPPHTGMDTTLPPSTMPPGRCALPTESDLTVKDEDLTGQFFGTYPKSRLEYSRFPASIRLKAVFSIDIKTRAENGVILYASDLRHTDFTALQFIDGKIRYSFNAGTGVGEITSDKEYNDGNWHTVRFARVQRDGTLEVDGEIIGSDTSPGRSWSLNVRAPYFVGGLAADPGDISSRQKKNLEYVVDSYVGCIHNFKLNDIDIGNAPKTFGIIPCASTMESGAFFYNNGGYIRLEDSFSVGQDFELELEVRPRSLDGVIFDVHSSREDFLVLQMVAGELQFTADNGAGAFTAVFTPQMNNKLCDGNWHTIRAIKNKNVNRLSVDGGEFQVITSAGSATATDTSNPIYVGGVPADITKGIKAESNYLGCIRNIVVNSVPKYLATGTSFESVKLDMCPVN